MIYNLFKDGEYVNRIVADEDFISGYCRENGYTCEAEIPAAPEPKPEAYGAEDMLRALAGG